MANNEMISNLLSETKAYTDLPNPVILTSGEIGVYFINTEKLVQDGGKFNDFGEKPKEMIAHAVEMMTEHPFFEEVINILAEKVDAAFPANGEVKVISGGQRRDWLFSGPVAHKLGLPHISLFKDGKIEYTTKAVGGTEVQSNAPFSVYAVHIADLMTVGSSAYNPRNNPATGWVPMLRDKGVTVKDYFVVVDRLQKGDETLGKAGITLHSMVDIDEAFLEKHSTQTELALEYSRAASASESLRRWTENFLAENGALYLAGHFNPEGKKIERAGRFIGLYGDHLKAVGKFDVLDQKVQEQYGKPIEEIVGGK